MEGQMERRGGLLAGVPTYVVTPLQDIADIRRLLEGDRPYTAYALGQLEPRYFRLAEWWTARGPQGQALVAHSRGGLGEALFALGPPEAVDAILRLHPGPLRTFATAQVAHAAVLRRHFFLSRLQPMLRMLCRREQFRPPGAGARRLHGSDIRALNALYNSEGSPTWYTSYHIQEGIYYGVFEDGQLVAVAGTHVVSPQQGIGVVGNVFTHPRFRNRGYATLATGAATAEVLRLCGEAVLTVDPANAPAVAAYRRLGYREHCRMIESAALRRDLLSLGSMVQRFFARLRAGTEGGEVVVQGRAEGAS